MSFTEITNTYTDANGRQVTVTQPAGVDFDWSVYDNWNGKSLKANAKVKSNGFSTVYCHESYAQEMYDKYMGNKTTEYVPTKELVKDSLVKITDLQVLKSGEIIATVNGGSNNIIIDLSKEARFLNTLTNDAGQPLSKEEFVHGLQVPTFKNALLAMDLVAKVGTKGEKASISDGYEQALSNEMKEQITKKSKAYWATIDATNTGGFEVTVANTIKAFMPGSMAAANRIFDFDALVGRRMEVMVENWDKRYGFIVSRKKFIKTVLPMKLQNLLNEMGDDKDKVFRGRVTGHTKFGVFVQLDEFITGLIHKTLVSDDLQLRMKCGELEVGDMIDVYVNSVENDRLILSDVKPAEQPALVARREAEEEAIKKAEAEARGEVYVPKKKKQEKKQEKPLDLTKLVEKYNAK